MTPTEICTQVSDALSSIPLSIELKARWNDVSLEENHVPKVDLPEMCLKDHIIGMAGQHINYEVKTDGRTKNYRLLMGESLIIPAKQAFVMSFDQAHVSKALHLSDKLLKRNALELWDRDKFELIQSHQVQDPLIENIQKALSTELRTNLEGCDIYAQTMGNALAIHLLSRYSTYTKPIKLYSGGLSPQNLKLVMEFINDNLDKDLSLDNLANIVQLSQYHFAHAFKQSLGISPHQYVIQQRVELSKNLLKQRTVTINEISIKCGFSSPSHFAKCFRQHIGVSPKQFCRM
jgi:AraC family transcriptional regulator